MELEAARVDMQSGTATEVEMSGPRSRSRRVRCVVVQPNVLMRGSALRDAQPALAVHCIGWRLACMVAASSSCDTSKVSVTARRHGTGRL